MLNIAPVLLIGFNRPEIIKQSFARIREVKPSKLYIAIDGPRSEVENEKDLVEQVKKEVSLVDWDCEVHYKYNETNKGAEVTVSSAISWVLKEEEFVIIIEDDVIASKAFFQFAEEMLVKYKDVPRVSSITASNFTPIPFPDNTDYCFAKYGHSGGGWATWKRQWNNFDLNIEIKKEHLQKRFLSTICNSEKEAKYYQNLFKIMRKKGIGNNTWDVIGLYNSRVNDKLSIIPRVNLSSNIGIYGYHASGKTAFHYMEYDDNFIVNKHPKEVKCFTEYDKHHFEEYICQKKRNILYRIMRKFNRMIKGNNK